MREISTVLLVLLPSLPSFSYGQYGAQLQSHPLYQIESRRLQVGRADSIVRNQEFATHYFDLYVGNPAQARTLAVTTNSDHSALACEECKDCGRLRFNVFNSTASSTFSEVPCGQCSSSSQCNGDRCTQKTEIQDLSTWSGYEVRDHAFHGAGGDPEDIIGTDAAVSFGFQFQFFCMRQARGYFEKSVKHGILGMSPAPTSFVNQMFLAGKLKKPRFSLCFNDKKSLGNDNKNTGVVTFGGYEASFLDTDMVFAKKLSDPGREFSYKINIAKLHIRIGGGASIRTNEQHTYIAVTPGKNINTEAVLDSSVPFLKLDKGWESHFNQAWKRATGKPFSYGKVELSLAELERLPTLVIEIEGDPNDKKEIDTSTVPNLTPEYNVLFAVPASHYMERLTTGHRSYRPLIQFEGVQGSIIGSSAMLGHSISYEIDNNRIGFAESSECEASYAESRGRGADSGSNAGNEASTDTTSEGHASGVVSINTVNTASASSADVTRTSSENDDLFIGGIRTTGSNEAAMAMLHEQSNERRGGCSSANCRCFMAIGYIFIGSALGVVYRISRPKERTPSSFNVWNSDTEPLVLSDDTTTYRRKTWHEGGVLV